MGRLAGIAADLFDFYRVRSFFVDGRQYHPGIPLFLPGLSDGPGVEHRHYLVGV